MLEFDIETAKLALAVGSGRIVTRSGQKVEIIEWNRVGYHFFPIMGKIFSKESWPTLSTWTYNGRYFDSGIESENDLFIEELC